MVVLDTNVVSELMRPAPDLTVEAWVSERAAATLFFSAVGEAELRYGVAVMPASWRRDTLAPEIEAMLREDFAGRILPFDSEAARAYAGIVAARRATGFSSRLSDRGHCAFARRGGGDA